MEGTVHTHRADKDRNAFNQWDKVDKALGIKVTANNVRGLLGRVATGIAQAGVNIEHVDMDGEKPGVFTELNFKVQVSGRTHLATLMRSLRRIPDVIRITREQE